jgi:hypothetical protein
MCLKCDLHGSKRFTSSNVGNADLIEAASYNDRLEARTIKD